MRLFFWGYCAAFWKGKIPSPLPFVPVQVFHTDDSSGGCKRQLQSLAFSYGIRNKGQFFQGIVLLLVLLNAIILEEAYVSNPGWYKLAWITVPLMLITIALSWRKGS